jgi:hypothetical protein
MSARGSAGKSASGAAMSKYDVEVEARLKKLEAQAHEKCSGGGASADLLQRIEALETALGHIKKTSIWNSKWD